MNRDVTYTFSFEKNIIYTFKNYISLIFIYLNIINKTYNYITYIVNIKKLNEYRCMTYEVVFHLYVYKIKTSNYYWCLQNN